MAVNFYDVLVRLQLGGCCAGRKLDLLVNNLLYGGDCIDQKFKELARLLKYLEILECYVVPTLATDAVAATRAIVSYNTSAWTAGTNFNLGVSLNFTIGGLSSYGVIGATSNDQALADLVIILNVAAGFTIATYSATTKVFTLSYPTTGSIGNTGTMTWTVGGAAQPTIAPTGAFYLSGGTDEVAAVTAITADDIDNCITEEQLLSIFEDISTICNICFEPIGFQYLQPIPTSVSPTTITYTTGYRTGYGSVSAGWNVSSIPPVVPVASDHRIIHSGEIRRTDTGDQRTYTD